MNEAIDNFVVRMKKKDSDRYSELQNIFLKSHRDLTDAEWSELEELEEIIEQDEIDELAAI